MSPEDWRAEMLAELECIADEPLEGRLIIQDILEQLIEECPHEEVKAWTRKRLEWLELLGLVLPSRVF